MKEPLRMLGITPKKEESLKTPRLTIRYRVLCATDEGGRVVTPLILLDLTDVDPAQPGARNTLAGLGYRTDWAAWSDDGAFIRLLEDVES